MACHVNTHPVGTPVGTRCITRHAKIRRTPLGYLIFINSSAPITCADQGFTELRMFHTRARLFVGCVVWWFEHTERLSTGEETIKTLSFSCRFHFWIGFCSLFFAYCSMVSTFRRTKLREGACVQIATISKVATRNTLCFLAGLAHSLAIPLRS